MNTSIFAFDAISRPSRREWLAVAGVAAITLLFLPVVLSKTVVHGQGDVQVFFRAAWAVWTGYPLYEVTDHHGWTYHYPPTLALLLGLFADALPGHPRPWWALPFPAAVVVWYLINAVCLLLSLHVWANALERHRPMPAHDGFLRGPWLLRLGPLLALLPFAGNGLGRGQPTPLLLLLIVLFLVLYAEKRTAAASCAFALAVSIKLFPAVLAVLPLFRRDYKFIFWAAGWCAVFLVGLPAVCLGLAATLDLYRTLFNEHLAGMASGLMSTKLASEVSPGSYSSVGVGAMAARIAAGRAFYSAALPGWASALQFLFDAAVIAAVVILGRGGFWNLRGAQPAAGYPMLVAGGVLSAAIPLMISSSRPNYITFAVPLMGVFLVEAWRRAGEQRVTGTMVGWALAAWLSIVTLDLPWSGRMPWDWLRIIGPMTAVLLVIGPASLALVAKASATSEPRSERP